MFKRSAQNPNPKQSRTPLLKTAPSLVDSGGFDRDRPPGQAACFFVAIHDVAPSHRAALAVLLAELKPRIGCTFAMAVTPRLGGRDFCYADWAFARETSGFAETAFDGPASELPPPPELLLHGLTHRRAANLHPISMVNRFCDEWVGKTRVELEAELAEARVLVRAAFGREPIGVVAPCWRWGAFDAAMMRDHKLGFAVGYRSMWFANSAVASLSLASSSRDWGLMTPAHALLARWPRVLNGPRVPDWNRLLKGPRRLMRTRFGVKTARRRQQAVRCIVFHPVDVRRGLHRAGLREIDDLLAAGAEPTRLAEVFGASTQKSATNEPVESGDPVDTFEPTGGV